jgi:hypothetical protein
VSDVEEYQKAYPNGGRHFRGFQAPYVRKDMADAALAEKDVCIAEMEAELQMAYENADFDEPLTFKEYRADLQEQTAARAKYEAERITP